MHTRHDNWPTPPAPLTVDANVSNRIWSTDDQTQERVQLQILQISKLWPSHDYGVASMFFFDRNYNATSHSEITITFPND
jgi:hypothetical protein